MACGILIPQPGIKPVSPALQNVFLTTRPPGRSPYSFIYSAPSIRWASLVAQLVKRLPAMQETWVWSLDQEDPLEKEIELQYSCLKNPMDRGAWEVTDYGVTSVGYKWVTKHTAHRYLKKQKDISLSLGQQRQTTIWQKPNTFVNPWWIRIANSTVLPRMSVEKYVKGMYVWKWETVLQAEGPESGKTRKEAEYYWGDSSAWEGNCRVELVK